MPTQVIVHAPYDVRLDEMPSIERPLGDFELLVRAEVGVLSPGTEARIYSGRGVERFSYRVSYPFPLGYNNVGKVAAVGSKVTSYRPGQRVFTCMPHLSEFIVAEQAMGESGRPASPSIPQHPQELRSNSAGTGERFFGTRCVDSSIASGFQRITARAIPIWRERGRDRVGCCGLGCRVHGARSRSSRCSHR